MGLRAKLLGLVVGVSLLGVLASSVLVLTLQRQQLIAAAVATTNDQSRVVRASLHDAMLHNDVQSLTHIVESMSGQETIQAIRILDAHGVVQHGSDLLEVGQRFAYERADCQFCHSMSERPLNATTIMPGVRGSTILLNVHLINNEPQCYTCHPQENKVLGLMMIEAPMSGLDRQLTDGFWRIVIAALVTIALLVGGMTLALDRMVLQPVSALRRGMYQVRQGNLDSPIHVPAGDELGELARSFDAMCVQLKASLAEMDRREQETIQQVRYLAILEERDRLAREMHDNLAQVLGFLNVKASVIDDLVAKGRIEEARASLIECKQIAKQAYTDVRESIFSLRTTVSNGWGLVSTLREHLAEYRMHYGIDAQLVLPDERLADFPPEVQVQVNRVIQEALTNVRKHSGAQRAWVRFERFDHTVRIGIEDDGNGFDPANLTTQGAQHFGLDIMRERAESVGGKLEVRSQNGTGTRVLLELPVTNVQEG